MKALKPNRAMLASRENAVNRPAYKIATAFYRRDFFTLDAAKRHADELCETRNWQFALVKEYFSGAVVYTAKKSTLAARVGALSAKACGE